MFALMLFMFFFFLGFVAMFFYTLKRLDEQTRSLSDEHAQLRVLLRALESRLDKMVQIEKINSLFQGQMEAGSAMPENSSGHDPLLHLSFEHPQDINMGQKLDLKPAAKNWDLELLPDKKASGSAS